MCWKGIDQCSNGICGYCGTHFQCDFCDKLVKGLLMVCPDCGHGGHSKELQNHFKSKLGQKCVTGCGHACFKI